MFYLSILIILLGLLILIYSVFLDVRSRRPSPSDDVRPAGPLYRADQRSERSPDPTAAPRPREAAPMPSRPAAGQASTPRPAQPRPANPARPAPTPPRPAEPWPREAVRDLEPTPVETVAPPVAAPAAAAAQPAPEPMAVLYEDHAAVDDYGTGASIIDASLQRYREMRRIGRGSLIAEKDGLSFYLGKKLYRYDFRSLRDLKTGPDFVAAYLRGGGPARLFVLEYAPGLAAAIAAAYADYQRKASINV